MTPVVETNMSDNIGSGCAELEPYALRVTDDSMAPEFWEGCIIIIEPRHSAQSGQYAVVDYANDTTFRQFDCDRSMMPLKFSSAPIGT